MEGSEMPKEIAASIIMVITVVALIAGFAVFAATQEAASYRRFCNTQVTWWDALWLDLRIDECKKCAPEKEPK